MRNRAGVMRFAVVLAALAITGIAVADMSTLTLSNFSSDATDPDLLDATFDFDWDGATLTLEVTNLTSSPNAFTIEAIYFNAPDAVTSLSMAALTGWSFDDFTTARKADGMGTFDFAIFADISSGIMIPAEGNSETFTFSGDGISSASDFTSTLSTPPPSENLAFGAAKFKRGPGDDSGFGGTIIPAPGAALLGVLGLSFTGWVRRRAG